MSVTAQLILIQGDSTNFQQVIDLHSVNRSIGRAQNCDIVWGSLQISRQHASLEYLLPKWYIRDTSTNGLAVNGSKLRKGELQPLNDNDIISFIPTGSVRYRFRYMNNNSPGRNRLGFGSSASANLLSNMLTPQSTRPPAFSSTPIATSTPRRTPVIVAERPPVEVEEILVDSHSDSEDSNHSASLLSVDPDRDDFLSFSGDEREEQERPPSSPSLLDDLEEDESLSAFAPKRKHGAESGDSDNSLEQSKKKKLVLDVPADNKVESLGTTSASNQAKKGLKPSKLSGLFTDEQIAQCTDLATLKVQLKQCLTRLASTEVELKTVECERTMEREENRQKEYDVESVTAAIREENYKKILELLETELNCSVCNEVFIKATVLDCGHTFCHFCITEWSKKKKECPICRKDLKNQFRHIELDNFTTKMFESFSEEMSNKRTKSIKEREDEVKKADEAARAVPVRPIPATNDNFINYHAILQNTGYADFLAQIQQFDNALAPVSRNRIAGGGAHAHAARMTTGGNAAAERRRSARIQDRGVEILGTGAPAAGRANSTARRGRTPRAATTGSRSRNAAAAAGAPASRTQGARAPAAAAIGAVPPPISIQNLQMPVVVNLDDSANNNNGNERNRIGGLQFPNQLLNYLPRIPIPRLLPSLQSLQRLSGGNASET